MKQKYSLESSFALKSTGKRSVRNTKIKQAYSFGHSSRFDGSVSVYNFSYQRCQKSTYGGDTLKSGKSGAGIGLGQRMDLSKPLNDSPSSHKYIVPSVFDTNMKLKRGYTLSLSREVQTH